MSLYRFPWTSDDDIGSPESGVIGSFEPCSVGTRKQGQSFCKDSNHLDTVLSLKPKMTHVNCVVPVSEINTHIYNHSVT